MGAGRDADPITVFCAGLDQLRIKSGADVPLLVKRLGLSRAQVYAILGGRIKRPPDWDRVVRPLVDMCTHGDPSALSAWRQRHAVLTGVCEELRRRDRAAAVDARAGAPTPQAIEVPRQLPGATPGFTGRHAELAALTGLLDASPADRGPTMVISAIGGVAGVGKTALAVHWAHRVADRFPDGQLYMNFRGYDSAEPVAAADALAGLLRTLGVPGTDIPDQAEDRSRLYRSKLAGRRMLIVLDNARDGEQVRPLLPGDPGCVTVVTSRDALAGLVAADGARRLDLDLLPLPDAIALLRSLIGSRIDHDPGAAAELAELCDRLPLALRIAAELAVARRAVPLAKLVAELAGNRLDHLDAGEDRADVRAVFSWSVRQLPDSAAETFALLGLHPGTELDVHAAVALAGTTMEQAGEALNRLCRASLIQVAGPGRYAMHDLLRAYALEQASARDADGFCARASTRLFDYYLAAAAAAMNVLFPAEGHLRPSVDAGRAKVPSMADEAAARAWLDRERASLVAVIVHATDHGWPGHATSLAGTLFRYLIAGSYLPDADTIYRHALRAARGSGDLAAEASTLTSLGGIGLRKGQYREAADHYRAALDRYGSCSDRAGQGRVLHNLGITDYQLHRYRSAADYLRDAMTAFEDAGDRLGMAVSLSAMAGMEIKLGSLDEASEHLQTALQVFRDQNDRYREAEALEWAGELSLHRDELAQASAFYEQALAIYRQVDRPVGVAAGLRCLGQVSLRQGEYQRAVSYLRQAAALYQQTSHQHGETITLRTLAQALHEAGQPVAARAELAAALQLAAETGNTYHLACVHRDLDESHERANQAEQARHHWQQALTRYTQLGDPAAHEIRSRLNIQQTQPDL